MDSISSLNGAADEMDSLTGLWNPVQAEKQIGELCRTTTGTLLLINLDHFRFANDMYGKEMGEQILVRFSDILRGTIRSSDCAGRFGEGEFLVFCRDIRNGDVIRTKAKQMDACLSAALQELLGENTGIPLSVSAGAAAVPDNGTEFSTLIEKAKKALDRVRQNKKQVCWIYQEPEKNQAQDLLKNAADSLDDLQMILEERTRQHGAYELGFESFRTVYRYVQRIVENYHRTWVLLRFTLRNCGDHQEITNSFGEHLGNTLRRSDVYARSGKNQFVVLLAEMAGVDEQLVVRRIMKHWDKLGSTGTEIVQESLRIRNMPK